MFNMSAKLKKKAVRVKHQKVKLFRANEPFISVMMWGVNYSVSSPSFILYYLYFVNLVTQKYRIPRKS